MTKTNKKILIIAAHPDDEILGCGATVARMISEGAEAYTIILGEGKTSRDVVRDKSKREEELNELQNEIKTANNIIGIKDVFVYDFPDNRFDSVALLDIVKVIEEIKEKIKPDIIFTHFENDTNIDHNVTYRAVLTATRPMIGESVKEIYSFEVLSSTEWRFPLSFSPDFFVDVSSTIEKKVSAMNEYQSELREFPHPRSLDAIRKNAEMWGIKLGLKYAEAFKTIRRIK